MKNIEKLDKEVNRDFAFRVIRENIIKLELKPGSMISEQEIAEELNLSRTPIHEALQELARTKIVEILPQKGCLVSLVDINRVNEAVFMRSTIESAVTEEVCSLVTDADIAQLEENLKLQQFYSESNLPDKFIEQDNLFHEIMYRITNKMQCHYMVKLMNVHFDRFREITVHEYSSTPVFNEHVEILNAIKARDGAKAKDATVRHIHRLYSDLLQVQKRYPDYFAK